RVAQPGDDGGEQRRIHLGDFAEVHGAHALFEVAPRLLEHRGHVGERDRAAHHDAPALAADHFFSAGGAASSEWFFASTFLITPSMPTSRTVEVNSVR